MVNKKLRFISRLIMCSLVVLATVGVGESAKAVDNAPKMLTAWENGSETSDIEKSEAKPVGAMDAADTDIQPRNYTMYKFSLSTYGEIGEDLDVTVTRRKHTSSAMLVKGIDGDSEPIIIWAVGQYSEGYHDIIDCKDCSDNHRYYFDANSLFFVENIVHQCNCTYAGLAGMATTEYKNSILGEFAPDYDEAY